MSVAKIFKPASADYDFLNQDGHKVILTIGQVQSGKTNFIINTTMEALDNYDYDCAIILGGTNNQLLKQTEKRFREIHNDYLFFNLSNSKAMMKYMPEKKFIISCLKGSNALNKVKSFFKHDINYHNILIIDDESDYASIKTKKTKAVYDVISWLHKKSKKSLLLSVTATPFANLMNESWELDDIIQLSPSEGYTGIDFFMENRDCFRIIEDSSNQLIVEDGGFWIDSILDHVMRVYDYGENKSQFIINYKLDKDVHEELKNRILSAFKVISNVELSTVFPEDKYDLDKVLNILEKMYDNIIVMNNNYNETSNWKNTHSIIIGGHKISRGYTFENLITTVMINEPKAEHAADTLMQRARWFGYRTANSMNNYKDVYKYMKIYCTERTMYAYEECQVLNDIVFKNKSVDDIKEKINEYDFKYIIPTRK